jgi:hypothetical protein
MMEWVNLRYIVSTYVNITIYSLYNYREEKRGKNHQRKLKIINKKINKARTAQLLLIMHQAIITYL